MYRQDNGVFHITHMLHFVAVQCMTVKLENQVSISEPGPETVAWVARSKTKTFTSTEYFLLIVFKDGFSLIWLRSYFCKKLPDLTGLFEIVRDYRLAARHRLSVSTNYILGLCVAYFGTKAGDVCLMKSCSTALAWSSGQEALNTHTHLLSYEVSKEATYLFKH